MFNIGSLIIYSASGICQIDDICEKTYLGVTNTYYVLHPLDNTKLTISAPVDSDKVVMLGIIDRDEAEEILDSFKQPGTQWIERNSQRAHEYFDLIMTGKRKDISKVVNTLMRKKHEAELKQKKLSNQDAKLLTFVQNTLFTELAMSMNTTFDEILEKANNFIILND